MNLLIAKTTLKSRPPKHLIELTAYEAVVAVITAALLVMSF